MESLKNKVKSLATSLGADLVGITSRDLLSDGPPSADPRYILPSTHSVISFAVSLNSPNVQDFISKKAWRPHCDNRKIVVQTLYNIGDSITEKLLAEGHDAVNVDLNNNYRPEEGAADVTEMTEFHPEFSHRYAALASGIGRLGWSGNLLTPKYGALVELGSVLTSADIQPDPPIPDQEHPCDKCKMCSMVCPVGMIHPRISCKVTVAGITETISQKRPNTCCWIGCSGYEGLASSATWSNWSPYRLGRPLPENKKDLDALCIKLQKADPQMSSATSSFSNYKEAVFNPEWFYYTVCGFCRSVCSPDRKERLANRKLIINSGTAALSLDGSHKVAGENTVEVPTPFGLSVAVEKDELSAMQPETQAWPGQFPLDREVITYLRRQINSLASEEENTE